MLCFHIFPYKINLSNYLPPNFCPDVYAQTSFLSSVDLKSPHSLMCPKSFDLKYLPTLVTPSFFKFFSLLPSWLHFPHTPPSYLNMSLFSTEVSFSHHLKMTTPHGQGLSLLFSLSASSNSTCLFLQSHLLPLALHISRYKSPSPDLAVQWPTQCSTWCHARTSCSACAHSPATPSPDSLPSFPCWVWYCLIALGRLPASPILSLTAQEQKAWELYFLRHHQLVSGSSSEVHEQYFEGWKKHTFFSSSSSGGDHVGFQNVKFCHSWLDLHFLAC